MIKDGEYHVMRGQVLLEDQGTRVHLWTVSSTRSPRKDGMISARLISFSGGPTPSEVLCCSEASASFPDGAIRHPFHLVSALDVMKGKFPERLAPAEVPDAA